MKNDAVLFINTPNKSTVVMIGNDKKSSIN